jgi:hypothetical protein
MASIMQLRRMPKVEEVSDERGIGNGVIVTLKKGWTFDPSFDNRVLGEDTVLELTVRVKQAPRFDGPYDD